VAKANKKPTGKNVSKNKRGQVSSEDRNRFNMKMATVNKCIACKQQCERGLAYIEKMSKPGTIGYGVPCILTKGKAYQ
jgi:hypothetical protein